RVRCSAAARLSEQVRSSPLLPRALTQQPSVLACPRLAAVETQHVPRDRRESATASRLPFSIAGHSFYELLTRRYSARVARVQRLMQLREYLRTVVGLSA